MEKHKNTGRRIMLDETPPMIKIAQMGKSKNNSKFWLAMKYLNGRSAGLISRTHYLTVAGILLGVTALICVSSVMNGFRDDIRSRIVGTLSEIRISQKGGGALEDHTELLATLKAGKFMASPVIRNELLLKRGTMVVPTVNFGIDPALHSQVSTALKPRGSEDAKQNQGMVAGSILSDDFAQGGIALGAGLAGRLNVALGDEVQLLSPLFDVPTAFGLLPRVRSLRVVAIFSAGMPEYDEAYSYLPLEQARFFSGYGDEVDYVEVKTPSFDRSEHYARRLRSELADYTVEDWSSYDSSLYGAIRFEKYMMFVIMLFMYIIASFNLTGNMLKAIVQKKRELGLLKAIGYRETELRDLFLIQSLLLSSLGIAGGLVLASVLLIVQQKLGLLSMNLGAESMPLPVKIMGQDYLLVVAVSYLITILSVILPVQRLKRINAVELIRQTA